MLDFKIKSRIHDYEVSFIKNTYKTLKKEIHQNDIIITDNVIKTLYPNLFKDYKQNIQVIALDANENQKSYQELIPIINELITRVDPCFTRSKYSTV